MNKRQEFLLKQMTAFPTWSLMKCRRSSQVSMGELRAWRDEDEFETAYEEAKLERRRKNAAIERRLRRGAVPELAEPRTVRAVIESFREQPILGFERACREHNVDSRAVLEACASDDELEAFYRQALAGLLIPAEQRHIEDLLDEKNVALRERFVGRHLGTIYGTAPAAPAGEKAESVHVHVNLIQEVQARLRRPELDDGGNMIYLDALGLETKEPLVGRDDAAS